MKDGERAETILQNMKTQLYLSRSIGCSLSHTHPSRKLINEYQIRRKFFQRKYPKTTKTSTQTRPYGSKTLNSIKLFFLISVRKVHAQEGHEGPPAFLSAQRLALYWCALFLSLAFYHGCNVLEGCSIVFVNHFRV